MIRGGPTVAAGRATIPEPGSGTDLAIGTASAVRRYVAILARPGTSSEARLAASTAVSRRGTAVAAGRTAIAKPRPGTDLAVGAALPVGRHVARVDAGAKVGLAAGAAMGRRGAAESARGTAVAEGGPRAVELARPAAGAVGRGTARAGLRRWGGVAVAKVRLAVDTGSVSTR